MNDLEHSLNWEDPAEGTFTSFDQKEFFPQIADEMWNAGRSDFSGRSKGYLYVPKDCESIMCKLHFVFHGCGGSPMSLAKKYNELAALNNIIMVYPDTKCWDIHPNGIDP